MDAAGQSATGSPGDTSTVAPVAATAERASTLAPAENLPDDARTLVAPAVPERLLRRVADELREELQNALAKVVVDVSTEFGLPTPSMETGGDSERGGDAAGQRLLATGRAEDQEDVRLLVQELRATRSRVRELQQVVAMLEKDKRVADDRVALHSTLVKRLTRELVDERVAHMDTRREADSLRRGSGAATDSSAGDDAKSARSPLRDREASNNPWTSPGKPVASSTGGGAGSVRSSPPASKLVGFSFYSSDEPGGEDEPPSPSSSTHTLRGTLMGQFLPSSLLDSPQLTPTHANAPAAELSLLTEEKQPAEHGGSALANRRRASLGDNQTDHAAADAAAAALETKQPQSGTPPRAGADVGTDAGAETEDKQRAALPLQLSMLSELFDGVAVSDLEAALARSGGDAAAAVDLLVRTHASFHPGRRAGVGVGSGAGADGGGSGGSGGGAGSGGERSGAGHKARRGSGERSGGSAGPGGPNWKTELCVYYMQGKCNKTRRTCPFAHGESDLARPAAAAKAGYKTRLCPAFESGSCPKSRRDCPLAHGVGDLREPGAGGGTGQSTPAAAAAAAMAAAIPGGVNNPALLPPPTPRLQSYKTELCYYYLKGNCNYSKEECRFAHGPDDLRTVESNTIAQMNAAAAAAAAFSAGAAPPPAGFDKQLQWQQQQHAQSAPMAAGYAQHGFLSPAHALQSHRGAPSGLSPAFGFQPPPPPPPQSPYRAQPPPPHQLQHQHQTQPHRLPSPHAQPFRYLQAMDDPSKRSGASRGSAAGRRDSGASWPGYDPPSLPPPDF